MSSSKETKTVVLGEACEESDCEEISLTETRIEDYNIKIQVSDDNKDLKNAKRLIPNEQPITIEQNSENLRKGNRFSSTLFSSIGSATSLAKLVNYSAYNLLSPNTSQQSSSYKLYTQPTNNNDDMKNVQTQQQMPLLHKTLMTKNQQFYACMVHLNRHPYEKATNSFNSISQSLVHLQKNIQDIDAAVTRIKRERKNLNADLNLIA